MNLKYAPAVAMAISLALASSAQAVCVSPPFPPPFFTTFVQVDVSSQNDCEMVPIQIVHIGRKCGRQW